MAGKVNWYGQNVALVMRDALDEILTEGAFHVEAYAKPDAPVDTGFMRNAIYTIPANDNPSKRSETDPDGEYTSKKTGVKSIRIKASEPPKEKHVAMVHAAAVYTIYQEMKESFVYDALKKVKSEIGGIIKTVARKRNLD